VAIDYQIYLNMNALQVDIDAAVQGNQYPPLIFYIDSSQVGQLVTIHPPYDTWFSLTEIAADSEGFFKVASGHIANEPANQLVDITVHWWWNTSFSVGTPNADPTPGEDYYALALAEYQDLVAAYNDQVNEANAFFTQHERILSMVDGVEEISYSCGEECPITQGAGGDIDAAHQATHAALVADAGQALDAVNSSLKSQYDAYDTNAVAFLKSLEHSEQPGVLIKVVGSQAAPVADSEG
jgi:hypothetical protein